MDEIYIAVKFRNRVLGGRVYKLTGAPFHTMREAVRALGGRYEGSKKYWLVSNEARRTLAEKFHLEPDDFRVTSYENRVFEVDESDNLVPHVISIYTTVESRFTGRPLLSFSKRTKAEAEKAAARFISAYADSDDAMIRVGKELVGEGV